MRETEKDGQEATGPSDHEFEVSAVRVIESVSSHVQLLGCGRGVRFIHTDCSHYKLDLTKGWVCFIDNAQHFISLQK